MKKLKLYPRFRYLGPHHVEFSPWMLTLTIIPTVFVNFENHWGLEIGIAWLFWHAHLQFAIIDTDEVERITKGD